MINSREQASPTSVQSVVRCCGLGEDSFIAILPSRFRYGAQEIYDATLISGTKAERMIVAKHPCASGQDIPELSFRDGVFQSEKVGVLLEGYSDEAVFVRYPNELIGGWCKPMENGTFVAMYGVQAWYLIGDSPQNNAR